MIQGEVNARGEAVIRCRLRGPSGSETEIDAVVDTGFTASLTLPSAAIAMLGLAHHLSSRAVLTDGSRRQFDIYAAELEWSGGWRPVLISALGNEALVGMRLLAGHELRIEVVTGGVVQVNALPGSGPTS
jgi:clan AA aspartic protease